MKGHLLLVIGLALGVAVMVALAAPAASQAAGTGAVLIAADGAASAPGCARWVLAAAASDTGDCGDPAHPCGTVQYAIDQALSGDRICVAFEALSPGPTVYSETILITRSLILDGKWQATCAAAGDGSAADSSVCSFTPAVCQPERVVLDARGAGRAITIRGHIAPVVDCFTVTGGDASGLGGDPQPTIDNDAGGGIYSQDASPIIINSLITGNVGCRSCPDSSGRGGGVYLLNASARTVVSGNRIESNIADEPARGQGGGLMLRDSYAQVLHNVIQNNQAGQAAGDGGGISVQGGGPTLAYNDILSNVAGLSGQATGGGVYVWYTASVTVEHNLIQGNVALAGTNDPGLTGRGGGLYYHGAPGTAALIRDNMVRQNSASSDGAGQGGGLFLEAAQPDSLVTGNAVVANVGGYTSGEGGGYYVQRSELTLGGEQIAGNYASSGGPGRGGGLFIDGGTVSLIEAVITKNVAGGVGGYGRGGGAYITATLASLTGNQFISNVGARQEPWPGSGGALEVHNSPGSRIEGNLFDQNEAPVYGGAILLQASDEVTFVGNTVSHNRALQGGGGYILSSDAVALEANSIVANTAAGGGGLSLYDTGARLDNNVIADNEVTGDGQGAGIWFQGNRARLRHNTIARNRNGSGIQVSGFWGGSGQIVLTNTILVSHTVGISVEAGSLARLEATLWGSDAWANGQDTGGAGTIASGTLNYRGDPAFVDPANENYALMAGSAALDRGVATGVTRDLDRQPRPHRLPALGAYELWPPGTLVYLPLVMNPH